MKRMVHDCDLVVCLLKDRCVRLSSVTVLAFVCPSVYPFMSLVFVWDCHCCMSLTDTCLLLSRFWVRSQVPDRLEHFLCDALLKFCCVCTSLWRCQHMHG